MNQPPSMFHLPRFIPQTSKHYHNVSIYKLLNWSILNVFSPYHFQMHAIISKGFFNPYTFIPALNFRCCGAFLDCHLCCYWSVPWSFCNRVWSASLPTKRTNQGKCCCPRRHEPLERVTFRNTSFLSNSSEESVYTVRPALLSVPDSTSTHSHAD